MLATGAGDALTAADAAGAGASVFLLHPAHARRRFTMRRGADESLAFETIISSLPPCEPSSSEDDEVVAMDEDRLFRVGALAGERGGVGGAAAREASPDF